MFQTPDMVYTCGPYSSNEGAAIAMSNASASDPERYPNEMWGTEDP